MSITTSYKFDQLPQGDSGITSSSKDVGANGTIRRTQLPISAVLVVLLYACISPAIVLANKHVLTQTKLNFPIALVTLGQGFTGLCLFLHFRVLGTGTLRHSGEMTLRFYLSHMGVVGMCLAGAISMGTASYMYLSLPLIQAMKAGTPGLVHSALHLTGVQKSTAKETVCVLLMACGALTTLTGELKGGSFGVALMLGSKVCECGRLVLTQKLLKNLELPAMESLYYMAPITASWTFLACAILEGPRIIRERSWETLWRDPWLVLAAMVLGFGINVSQMFVIKLSNAVIMKLVGVTSNIGLVLYGTLSLHEVFATQQIVGYSTMLVAFACYNWIRCQASGEPMPR